MVVIKDELLKFDNTKNGKQEDPREDIEKVVKFFYD